MATAYHVGKAGECERVRSTEPRSRKFRLTLDFWYDEPITLAQAVEAIRQEVVEGLSHMEIDEGNVEDMEVVAHRSGA